MYFYLYKITNLLNNNIYIGIHKTADINDNYMGSGKIITSAIKKYGIENFKKDILEYFTTSDEMFKREKEIVNEDFLSRTDVYNLRRGGFGGFDLINKDAELLKERNTKIARNRDNKSQIAGILLAKTKESYKKNMSEAQKERFKNNPGVFKGKHHTDETKKIMSDNAKERLSDPTKNSQYGTCWVYHDKLGNKKIKNQELSYYLNLGYIKGRKIKN